MTTTTLDRPVTTPQTVCPMPPKRLSEALRRGARLHPQAIRTIYSRGRTCAIGAILAGLMGADYIKLGPRRYSSIRSIVLGHTGVDLDQVVPRPPNYAWDHVPPELWNTIIYLNDRAGWTREQIANWLESLNL